MGSQGASSCYQSFIEPAMESSVNSVNFFFTNCDTFISWESKPQLKQTKSGGCSLLPFVKSKEKEKSSCSNMGGPRDCHTGWNKSERERKKSYDTAYIWTLKNKWYKWTYLQNRNRVIDVENKLMVTGGKVVVGRDKLGDCDWHIYTIIYKIGN